MYDVDAIFNILSKASEFIHKQDEINKARKHLVGMEEKKCGMCQYWMRSDCKPEKELGQFKSAKSFPCKDFEREQIYKDMIVKRKEKLKSLEGK